jgi:purine nucleosidase
MWRGLPMFKQVMAALGVALMVVAGPVQAQGQGQGAAQAREKVILDDDGFALMQLMLLASPRIEVLGITTVSGDMWANRVTARALRGLELAGRSDVPVVPGATFPLVNSEADTERWEGVFGKLVWKGAWMKQWVEPTAQTAPVYYGPFDPVNLPFGNPTTKPADEVAANFLIRMVHKYPGQITIVACGPMTNLALAQKLDPQFASLAKGLVYMGGSLNPAQVLANRSAGDFAREFVHTPRREFNIRFDPEAASIMARSPWAKITMVPVDPSTATQLTPELIARLAKVVGPRLAPFVQGLEPGFPLWDEIAAAVLLDPGVVREGEAMYVDFDHAFGPGYGDTLSWREGYQPKLGERKQAVVKSLNVARFEAVLAGALAGKP